MPPTTASSINEAAAAHFAVVDDSKHNNLHVRCNFCLEEFHTTKKRLVFHLAGVKGGSIRICAKVPTDVKNSFKDLLPSENDASDHHSSASRLSSDREVIDLDSIRPTSKQLKLDDVLLRANRERADQLWARFIYAESIPFRKLSSPFFQEALQASIGIPGYKPPGRKPLTGRLLDAEYNRIQENLGKTCLHDLASTGKCFSLELVSEHSDNFVD